MTVFIILYVIFAKLLALISIRNYTSYVMTIVHDEAYIFMRETIRRPGRTLNFTGRGIAEEVFAK